MRKPVRVNRSSLYTVIRLTIVCGMSNFSVCEKYHVIRYDLRGYGISSSQTEDYQFMHVEDLVTLMDSLHIKKAHIVGLSLGGFITADMLAYFPDRMLSAF